MSDHPLCCECDDCIGPGAKLPYAPIVHTTLGRPNNALKRSRRGAALVGGRGALALEPALALRNAYLRVIRRWRERTTA